MPESEVVIASGEAEGEEVRLRIRAQDPERQHDQPRQRLGDGRRVGVDQRRRPRAARRAIASADVRPVRRLLRERAPDDAIDRGDRW